VQHNTTRSRLRGDTVEKMRVYDSECEGKAIKVPQRKENSKVIMTKMVLLAHVLSIKG